MIASDGPLRSFIEEELKEEIKHSRVKLLGWLPHNKVPEFLSIIRVLLLPSYTEGLPSFVVESLVFGTPVIVSSVGKIPKIIRNGKTGILLDTKNPEKISSLVLDTVNNTHAIREMPEQAFLFAKESFNERDFMKGCKEIFNI